MYYVNVDLRMLIFVSHQFEWKTLAIVWWEAMCRVVNLFQVASWMNAMNVGGWEGWWLENR